MYFVLAGFMHQFRYLKTSLVFVLAYVGVKMLVSHHYPIPNMVSLAFIAGILVVGVLASLLASSRRPGPDNVLAGPGVTDPNGFGMSTDEGPAEWPERPFRSSESGDKQRE
jgi:hypothetical protein